MGVKLSSSKKQKGRKMQVCAFIEEKSVSIQDNIQEESTEVLQKLMNEEANLIEKSAAF